MTQIAPPRSTRAGALFAASLMAAAVLLGALGRAVILALSASPARGVTAVLLIYALAGATLLAWWWWTHRDRLRVDEVTSWIFTTALLLMVASYFTAELSAILFRADMLIWSESPFVNDIIKFRVGAPLYDAPVNLDSFFYTPGAQFLTHLLASLAGLGQSVPAMRVIQLLYVGAAVVMGVRVASRLVRLRGGGDGHLPWTVAWAPLLFLAGTNSLTNNFTHLLHNDALALAVSAGAFLVITEYAVTRRPVWLVAMVLLPTAGFLVKQSLGIWCILFPLWLIGFDRPLRPGRVALTALGGGGLVFATSLAGIAIWGADYRYWVIDGLANHGVSPLRSFQHVLDGWAYYAAGFWAGWLLIRGEQARTLLGLWLVWFLLFAAETYTSGIAWMLNHMGPGSMIAAMWLAAALSIAWPTRRSDGPWGWHAFRSLLVTGIAVLLVSGLDAVRIPYPSLVADADRYAAAIEREFEGVTADSVLLDHGSWIYLKHGIIQRDRSAAAGEVGLTNPDGLSAMIDRIRRQHYARILVRDLDGASFMYDHGTWDVSSGVRKAMLESYQVVRTIDGVDDNGGSVWLRTISVLEPRHAVIR